MHIYLSIILKLSVTFKGLVEGSLKQAVVYAHHTITYRTLPATHKHILPPTMYMNVNGTKRAVNTLEDGSEISSQRGIQTHTHTHTHTYTHTQGGRNTAFNKAHMAHCYLMTHLDTAAYYTLISMCVHIYIHIYTYIVNTIMCFTFVCRFSNTL